LGALVPPRVTTDRGKTGEELHQRSWRGRCRPRRGGTRRPARRRPGSQRARPAIERRHARLPVLPVGRDVGERRAFPRRRSMKSRASARGQPSSLDEIEGERAQRAAAACYERRRGGEEPGTRRRRGLGLGFHRRRDSSHAGRRELTAVAAFQRRPRTPSAPVVMHP
jgi:hypothetical protein